MKLGNKKISRNMRRGRIRAKIKGTAERLRVSIFKSNRNVFVQFIDDNLGKTIISSKLSISKKKDSKANKTVMAQKIGELLAKKAIETGIKNVVFDRGGYKYHGRVKSLADGIRSGGVKL